MFLISNLLKNEVKALGQIPFCYCLVNNSMALKFIVCAYQMFKFQIQYVFRTVGRIFSSRFKGFFLIAVIQCIKETNNE